MPERTHVSSKSSRKAISLRLVNIDAATPNLMTMNRNFSFFAATGIVFAAIVLAACGGGSKSATPTSSGATIVGGGPHSQATTPTPAGPTSTPAPGFALGPNPTVTASGLKYSDEVVGTGVKRCEQVSVNYIGTFTNGKKFDASADRGSPFTFNLGIGQVIKGWDEGISTMKVGGKRVLYVPSALAYGAQGRAPLIPPNTDLLFEVQLVAVSPATNNC